MNRSRVEAFFKEFPFLKGNVPEKKRLEIKVEKADSSVLCLSRKEYLEDDGCNLVVCDSDRIIFFDREYNELGEICYGMQYKNPKFRWWQRLYRSEWLDIASFSGASAKKRKVAPHENVGEAIGRLKIAEQVYCVLRIVPFNFGDNGFEGYSITIYKPPKNFTLVDWLKGEPEREMAKLQQELVGIDSAAR